MRGQQARFCKLAFWGIPILVLGFLTTLLVAEPLVPKAAEPCPTPEIKSETLRCSDSLSPRGEEKEQEKAEEEPKCLDQRLLLALFHPLVEKYPAEKERQDLTFKNFFTDGWHTGWKEPEEGPDDALRSRLLRIQPAFWEREVRLAYNYTFGADSGEVDEQEIPMGLELPISRRFLIEFEQAVTGRGPKGGSWEFGGGDLNVIPEVMLWETKDISFSSGLFVRTPTGSRSVGEGRTSVTPYVALWKDLGLRVGLHTFFGAEFPLGGYEEGHPDAVLQYGIAPTMTVTPKDTPYLGNLTLFAEFNGTTDLGGRDGQTTVTMLPGVKWLLFKDCWLAIGYEFPLTGTNALESRVWVSLYRDF